MSYVWAAEGPAFEYPTCFRIENRVLVVRAAMLWLLAAVILVLAWSEPGAPAVREAVRIEKSVPGSPTPHVLFATLLLLLGAVDAARAWRQRLLRLGAGRPASLTFELAYQNSGASSGAAWLQRVIDTGRVDESPDLDSRKSSLLERFAPSPEKASAELRAYAMLHGAQALFALGVLAILAGMAVLGASRPGLAPAAVWLAALPFALIAYKRWVSPTFPGMWVLLSGWVVGALGAGALLMFAGTLLPQIAQWAPIQLPLAAFAALSMLVVCEGLAVIGAWGQADRPVRAELAAPAATTELTGEPERLLKEIDAELVRRWAEGVPNRRYVRSGPGGAADGPAGTRILEESQPMLPKAARQQLPARPPARLLVWSLLLAGIGVLMTLVGGVLWVQMANALMRDGSASWGSAAPALAMVLLGGYGVRLAHLLWSRIEVMSTLYLIDLAEPVTRPAPALLRARLVQVRSAFHAAGGHRIGSRRIVSLTQDAASAERFVQQVRGFVDRQPVVSPLARRASGGDARPHEPTSTPTRSPLAGASARYCSACGSPQLPAARFCHHCGAVIAS